MNQNSTPQFSRRSLLTTGGALVAGSAVLAACGGTKNPVTRLGAAPEIEKLAEEHVTDVALLRTAMSFETMVSNIMLDSKVFAVADSTTAPIVEAFASAHKAHLSELALLITARGGEPFTGTNEKLMTAYGQSMIDLVAEGKNKSDIAYLAHALESLTTSTYQYFVTLANEAALRAQLIVMGASSARRAAVAAQLITPGTGAFATTLDETGSPAVDKDGNALVATLPSAFGPLSSVQVVLGPVNPETQTRQTVLCDTPSLNSFIY